MSSTTSCPTDHRINTSDVLLPPHQVDYFFQWKKLCDYYICSRIFVEAFLQPLLSGKGISIKYYVCVCVCVCVCVFVALVIEYAQCHVPYCHVWLYHIFLHYLIKAWFSKKKKLLEIKYLFFSPQPLSEIFLFLRKIQRDAMINLRRPSCWILLILTKF
jgi:hypothetical protein